MSTRLPALAVAAIALSIAGCGGSGKSASTQGKSSEARTTVPSSSGQGEATSSQASARTPLSKAQLLAAGESVCRHLNKELAASKDVIRTQADYARVAPQRAAIVSASMVELKKLTPPASIAGDWQKIVSDRQSLDEYITKLGQDATAKDSNAIRLALASSSVVVQDLYAVATRVGLKECAHIG